MSKIDFNKQVKNEWFNVVKYGASTASTDNTAAFQAAINAAEAAGYGVVYIPAGNWNVNGTLTINNSYITIRGNARVVTQLSSNSTVYTMFSFPNATDQCGLLDLYLAGPGGITATNFAITLVNQSNFIMDRISITAFGQAISNTGNTNCSLGIFKCIIINQLIGDAIFIDTTIDGGTWTDIQIGNGLNSSTVGIHVTAAVGLRLYNVYTNGLGLGMYLNPTNGAVIGVLQCYYFYTDGYNAVSQYGIRFSPAAGGVINTVTFFGGGVSGYKQIGVLFDGAGTVQDVYASNFTVSASNATGIDASANTLTLQGLFLTDCWVEANGAGAAGTLPGINLQYATNVIIRGGLFAASSFGGNLNTQSYGIIVGGATTNVLIDGALVTPNVSGSILLGGTNTNCKIINCIGYNPLGIKVVVMGASPFTYTAGYTPETFYINSMALTSIVIGGNAICGTVTVGNNPLSVHLNANQAAVISYPSGAGNMFTNVE